ncbi:hypothetical protein ACVCAH_33020 [Micromonospora sp. LZ34]
MSVMKASDLLRLPKFGPATHYADLTPLRDAVLREDWPAVTRFFTELPAEHDPSVAVGMVADLRGVDGFLHRATNGSAFPTVAATLLGARWVRMGWDIRTARRARFVSRARFAQFHSHLARADQLLSEVTADEPDNIAAWTSRVRINRGLQLGLAEARRRYDRAAKARPNPYHAQMTMLQQLCPKWGGSLELMHAFAEESARQAPPGALNAALVAEAHIEHELHDEEKAPVYRKRREVRDQLRRAVAQSVGHPDFRPVHGWVQAHSSLAYAWALAGDARSMAMHFGALGDRVTDYPWRNIPGFTLSTYKMWQFTAYAIGGWR